MAAPQPAARPAYVIGTWPVSRFFMLAGFVCFLIAALVAGGVFSGPDLAWAFGGLAAWSLAWAL